MPRLAIATLAIAFALASGLARAEDERPIGSAPTPTGESARPETATPAPVYRLPKVGKPRGRIGGGRRGPITGAVEVRALAPDHVGRTTSAQPSLYWYLPEPVAGDVVLELTVIDESSIDPLVDRRLGQPPSAGLQRVRLSDLGISLEPGQEYQWSVALVPDPADHSKDVVASGWVQRVAPPEGIPARVASAGPDGAAAVYGEAGIWYDMLDAAFEHLRAQPESPAYREELASVLEQAGLPGDAARRAP